MGSFNDGILPRATDQREDAAPSGGPAAWRARLRGRRTAIALGLASMAALAASVAWGDVISGDLRNDVAGTVQSSATYTRADLPVEDVSYWWHEAKNRDPVDGCNADADNPVNLTITATNGGELWDGTGYGGRTASVPRHGCDDPVATAGQAPAGAGALPYRLPASMPLGRTTFTGAGSGGRRHDDGRTGTYTTKTLAINIRPRAPGRPAAAANGARSVDLEWTPSPDHADITSYQLRRRTGEDAYDSWSAPLDEATGTSYRDRGLEPSTRYCYQLRAVYRQAVAGSVLTFVSNETIESCTTTPANSAPGAPGRPELGDGSSTPNADGVFALRWTPAPDPDSDDVSYTLERRDRDHEGWRALAATDATSHSFTADDPEAEGTWTYRVRARDAQGDGPVSEPSPDVKVDGSAPLAPLADAGDPAFEDAGGESWYRDRATVSFSPSPTTANGDRDLQDGSPGSGVDSTSDAETFSSGGVHEASGRATDRVGHISAQTTRRVQVDVDAPKAQITGCPTEPVTAGAPVELRVSGEDAGAGLRSLTVSHDGQAPSPVTSGETVRVNTANVGTARIELVATDNVSSSADDPGHRATETCTVQIRYSWTGFFAPLDNPWTGRMNGVKGGQAALLTFSLGRDFGLDIFAPGYPKTQQISCGSTPTDLDTPADLDETTSRLWYVAPVRHYVYAWKTSKSWAGTCRRLIIRLNDGSERYVNFKVLK